MMVHIFSTLLEWINDATKLIAPQRCVICGRRLRSDEKHICFSCYARLPFTNIRGEKGNKIEKLFWGQFPIARANAFLKYSPHSDTSRIFLQLKYGNRPQVGYIFGRYMANDIIETDFFETIDCIIPLPLAKKRLKERGYNQSEAISKGISDVTGIPLDTHSVIRAIANQTQTRLHAEERKANVKNIFALTPDHTLNGKHVLLVDDILTTGATLLSCAQEIARAEHVTISIMVLGLAGSHFAIQRDTDENKKE